MNSKAAPKLQEEFKNNERLPLLEEAEPVANKSMASRFTSCTYIHHINESPVARFLKQKILTALL
jgi:hypothetical protein